MRGFLLGGGTVMILGGWLIAVSEMLGYVMGIISVSAWVDSAIRIGTVLYMLVCFLYGVLIAEQLANRRHRMMPDAAMQKFL
jgi:hypothetical protein